MPHIWCRRPSNLRALARTHDHAPGTAHGTAGGPMPVPSPTATGAFKLIYPGSQIIHEVMRLTHGTTWPLKECTWPCWGGSRSSANGDFLSCYSPRKTLSLAKSRPHLAHAQARLGPLLVRPPCGFSSRGRFCGSLASSSSPPSPCHTMASVWIAESLSLSQQIRSLLGQK